MFLLLYQAAANMRGEAQCVWAIRWQALSHANAIWSRAGITPTSLLLSTSHRDSIYPAISDTQCLYSWNCISSLIITVLNQGSSFSPGVGLHHAFIGLVFWWEFLPFTAYLCHSNFLLLWEWIPSVGWIHISILFAEEDLLTLVQCCAWPFGEQMDHAWLPVMAKHWFPDFSLGQFSCWTILKV